MMTQLSEFDIITDDIDNLIIGHLNSRSIVNTFDELKQYVLMQNFDCLAVSETWLKPHITSSEIIIPGYILLRMDRKSKRGGGVGIFLRKGIRYKLMANELSTIENNDVEQLWIEIFLKHKKLTIGVAYKPPNVHYSHLISLDDVLSTVFPMSENIVLLGDLNVDLFKTSSAKANFLRDIFSNYGLEQIIEDTTRPSSHSLLDIIALTNKTDVIKTGTVLLPNISDHLLVFVCLHIPKPHMKKVIDRKSVV